MNRTENLDEILGCLCRERTLAATLPPSLGEKQRLMRSLLNVREPLPVSEAFLNRQDAELRMQREDKGVVSIAAIRSSGASAVQTDNAVEMLLWQGDITRLAADAIVNAANSELLGCFIPLHGCIDNAIHSAAGVQLRLACHDLMCRQGHREPTGVAKITRGYNLPARHVIHTVGPIVETGIPDDRQRAQLASCYRACLSLADEHALESIAFCCISTGEFRFPADEAARIAVDTVADYLPYTVKTVIFNVFKDTDYVIYQSLFNAKGRH